MQPARVLWVVQIAGKLLLLAHYVEVLPVMNAAYVRPCSRPRQWLTEREYVRYLFDALLEKSYMRINCACPAAVSPQVTHSKMSLAQASRLYLLHESAYTFFLRAASASVATFASLLSLLLMLVTLRRHKRTRRRTIHNLK